MKPVKFSIVIPLYNKSKYVERAIKSVFSQTFPPSELIIVDDVSTDNSLSVVRSALLKLTKNTPSINVTLLHNKLNRGPGASRNYGLQIASGDYVLFLDADDEYQPLLLQKIHKLIKNASADMVIFGYRRLPENVLMPPPLIESPSWLSLHDNESYRLTDPLDIVYDRRFPIGPGSNVAVRRTLTEGTLYDESAMVFEGIDFWFRILQNMVKRNGKAFYLKGDYHVVHGVPESLIRKPLTFSDVEFPKILKRYSGSNDRYEQALRNRVAKIWFSNSFSRLKKIRDKIKFVWRYRSIIKVFSAHK